MQDMILPYTLGSQQQHMAVTLDTGSTIPFTTGEHLHTAVAACTRGPRPDTNQL